MLDRKKILDMLEKFPIPQNMLQRGMVGLQSFIKPIEIVLTQRKIPDFGWSDSQIRFFLDFLANLDSSNDPDVIRIGEREARISTPLLYELTAGFMHGVGRSGNLKGAQPKAVGGSLLNSLSDTFALYILKKCGLKSIKGAIVVPMSTGMTIMLVIRGIMRQFTDLKKKTDIIFPRMDHTSPLKAIELAGLECTTIESIYGEELLHHSQILKQNTSGTDFMDFINTHGVDGVYVPIQDIKDAITDSTFGILSTTSFFPPRAPDQITEIAKLAKEYNIAHIVNNGYGVQSPTFMNMIQTAMMEGRVDAIIQSTDKNFLTPIGGAIMASPNPDIIKKTAESYAGRANAAPIVHFVVSMLSMGIKGYSAELVKQKENRSLLEIELKKLAENIKEQVLNVKNPVACIMTLKHLTEHQISSLGGYLYNLRVTGPRVVNPKVGHFGASIQNYPYPYIVMNAAIGARKKDIQVAVAKLGIAYDQVQNKITQEMKNKYI